MKRWVRKEEGQQYILACPDKGWQKFLICRLDKKQRGHKKQVDVGMSENFWTLRHLLGLTSHISLWCLIQLCEFIRIVFHPVPKCLQIMQNIFTFQSLKIHFLNYVFKWREILLLLLIAWQFLQNIYALKGCTNLYFIANYWIATIPNLEKVCKEAME